jgi:hypothetical protein
MIVATTQPTIELFAKSAILFLAASKQPKILAHYNEEINVDYKVCTWI